MLGDPGLRRPQWSSWAHAGWADVCPSQAGALGEGGLCGWGGGLGRTQRETCVWPGALQPPEEGSHFDNLLSIYSLLGVLLTAGV